MPSLHDRIGEIIDSKKLFLIAGPCVIESEEHAMKMAREIKRVASGRAVVIPLSTETRGHGTHTVAIVWKAYLNELLNISTR